MGFYSKKLQIIIWLMVLIPVIVFWLPDSIYKPGLDFLLVSIISISVGVILMLIGSFKRIKQIKEMERNEFNKLKTEILEKNKKD